MKYLIFVLAAIAILFSSCLKEPAFISVQTVPNIQPAVGDTFALEIVGEADYDCLEWTVTDSLGNAVNAGSVVTISGGGSQDPSWQVRVDSSGWYNFYLTPKNCKKGDCNGTCVSGPENESGFSIY